MDSGVPGSSSFDKGCAGRVEMDKEEYTSYLKQRDEETRAERADRWSRFGKAHFGTELPSILFNYLVDMRNMYEDGYFLGAICLSYAILESALNDRLRENIGLTEQEMENSCRKLSQTAVLSGVIDRQQKKIIDEIRQYRNAAIHINGKKMATLGHTVYKDVYRNSKKLLDDLGSYATLLALDLGDVGDKAFQYVKFTRDLCLELYGSRQE